MRAIILNAGRGKRLLPLTEREPKCLLEVRPGRSLLHHQLEVLAAGGITEAMVLVGFAADRVEERLAETKVPGIAVETLYNPFFRFSDNLVTLWLARPWMTADFLLLNGDTLFEPAVLRRLLSVPPAPITVAIHRKDDYDEDDMKVSLAGDRLTAIAKTIPWDGVDAEAIGLSLFRGRGVDAIRDALDAAMREPEALELWYPSAIDGLAESLPISTVDATGLWWGEVDSVDDLVAVRRALVGRTDRGTVRAPHATALPAE